MVTLMTTNSSRWEPTSEVGSGAWDAEVVAAARAAGRDLVQFETDTGELVWSWSRADGTGPVFLERRLALTWMAAVLERADALEP
jgi:hypothetical protein